ncbi:formate/nitrite transporter family protein [Persicobacter psychrovividus]|uniref:Membrane protein n=1 Tax=Persicobacter psychrovividus TaxID=387638 RepID=A0ABN6L684_9BACT|nr:membrane protein [Persicobacter psychrovividus]
MGRGIFKSRDPEKNNVDKATLDKPKQFKQILDEQIEAGMHEFNRSNTGLFFSAFSAGLEIGFSFLFMCIIYSLFLEDVSMAQQRFYLAMCYPLGFIFVIIGRSELFTEHTAMAILPLLKKIVTIKELLVLWGIVYAGNLLGGYLFSFLITSLGPKIGFTDYRAFEYIAVHLVDYSWDVIFESAIFAGWMMGLLGWLVTSSQETISRIVVVIMVTAIIGMGGFHHCIVGSVEVFSGFLVSPKVTFMDYLKFQAWATLGNALGGSIFVAVLKFSHVRLK